MTVFLPVACLAAFFIPNYARAADRPSVIFFLADEIGAGEIGCYEKKDKHTPNLDKLAAEGVRLETFYANPFCTPTRVCLMTGQHG